MNWGWRPYVSAAKKRAKAQRLVQKLKKQGRQLLPIQIEGRTIAKSFWGKSWCENLERYSDYENRLPRGRTYARNGSILDLQMSPGKITAIVQGSDVYDVTVDLSPLPKKDWEKITRDCSQSIHSLLDLLQGRLSDGVMERLARPKEGLFPQPREIKIRCSCPDWAELCKHAAAVLYGVGARLDSQPELLFLLRQVDQSELIRHAANDKSLDTALSANSNDALQNEDLAELFGIELDGSTNSNRARTKRSSKPARKSTAKKSTTKPAKKSVKKSVKKSAAKPAKKPAATPKSKPVTKAAAKQPSALKVVKTAKPAKASRPGKSRTVSGMPAKVKTTISQATAKASTKKPSKKSAAAAVVRAIPAVVVSQTVPSASKTSASKTSHKSTAIRKTNSATSTRQSSRKPGHKK